MNKPANQLLRESVRPIALAQAKMMRKAEANVDPILTDFMELRPQRHGNYHYKKFHRVMGLKEKCACGHAGQCTIQLARLFFSSDLDHNSNLARNLKRTETLDSRKHPCRMTRGSLEEFRPHLSIMTKYCHRKKTLAERGPGHDHAIHNTLTAIYNFMKLKHIQDHFNSCCFFLQTEDHKRRHLEHRPAPSS